MRPTKHLRPRRRIDPIVLLIAAVFAALAAQISAQEVLRVGVTGDYRPFAYRDASGALQGIDVDLVLSLATHLDRDVAWVETSWPALLEDLERGAFDIAMSGISRTAERAAAGELSDTYLVTGKTLLARCDVMVTMTARGVNRPETHLIVNPGGTNEAFTRMQFPRARLTVHRDNLSVFDALAAGAADAMVTDMIEARWVAASNSGLCVPFETPFDRVEKVILMRRGLDLTGPVNAWLAGLRAAGALDAVIARHVADGAP